MFDRTGIKSYIKKTEVIKIYKEQKFGDSHECACPQETWSIEEDVTHTV